MYADKFDRFKVLKHMADEVSGNRHGFRIPRNPKAFRGKRKLLKGFAYYPVTKKTHGGTFKIFSDAAYQVHKGTFYRCLTLGNQIIPRF